MGSRAGRDSVPAGSPELSAALDDGPVDLSTGEPLLVAGRCRACGDVLFPLRARCPACASTDVERILLPRRGTLWTWTTQGFEPGAPPYVRDPGEFEPFAVGYVEFPGLVRIEGRLTEPDPERLRIGMEMEVVALEREHGVTYAFAPVAGPA